MEFKTLNIAKEIVQLEDFFVNKLHIFVL